MRPAGRPGAPSGRRPAAAGALGFTLIELLVVLVIAGLAMVIVVPALDNLTPRHSLRAAARDMAGLVDYTRGTAAGQGRIMAIYYDLDRGRYRSYGPPPDGMRPEGPWGLAPIGRWRTLPGGVRFAGIQAQGLRYQQNGLLRVRFDPVAIDGSHIVHLVNDRGEVYSVKYNAFLGQSVTLAGEADFEDGS